MEVEMRQHLCFDQPDHFLLGDAAARPDVGVLANNVDHFQGDALHQDIGRHRIGLRLRR